MFTACRGSACGFFGVRLYSLSVLNEAIPIFLAKLTLIDSGLAVARQTARILIKNELLFDEIRQNHLQIECFVSGNNADELKFVLKHMIKDHMTWRIHNIDD
jgi:glutamate racemase